MVRTLRVQKKCALMHERQFLPQRMASEIALSSLPQTPPRTNTERVSSEKGYSSMGHGEIVGILPGLGEPEV